jgi:hypothetical protein
LIIRHAEGLGLDYREVRVETVSGLAMFGDVRVDTVSGCVFQYAS